MFCQAYAYTLSISLIDVVFLLFFTVIEERIAKNKATLVK